MAIRSVYQKQSREKTGIYYLKPIYKLSNLLGLAPPYDFDNFESKTQNHFYKYYCTAILCFLITTYIYSMYGSISRLYQLSQTTTIIIQILYYLFIMILNVITVFGSFIQNKLSWKKMLDTFKKLDSQINLMAKKRLLISTFNLQIIVGHLLLITVLGYDAYVGQDAYGIELFQYFICIKLEFYLIFITVILMCHFALAIKNRFESFNEILRKITIANTPYIISKKSNSISPININIFTSKGNLKNITRMFSTLSELVNLYNKIFGWQILVLMGIVLMALLESFNFIMVYGIASKEVFGKNLPADMIARSLASTLMFLVNIMIYSWQQL